MHTMAFNMSAFQYRFIAKELMRLGLDEDGFFELLLGIYSAKMRMDKKCGEK